VIIAAFLFFSLPRQAFAGNIYKWVDEKGGVHFSQVPPLSDETGKLERWKDTSAKPQFERDPTQKEIPWPEFLKNQERKKNTRPKEAGKKPEKVAVSEPVKIYTTSWCGYCKQAKAYLKELGVPYIEYNVEKDPIAQTRKERLAPRSGVPVAVINGRVVRGFNPKTYLAALKRSPD